MLNKNRKLKNERELQKAILREKVKGTSDLEIGKRYGVTFRFIERLMTRLQGVNVSSLKEEIGQHIVGNIGGIGRLIFQEM